MFKKTPTEKPELDIAISDLFADMADNHITKSSDEFAAMVDQVVKLYKLKEIDSNVNSNKNHVSKDTLAIIAANLVGIVMIVGHERANVVTSKALTLLMKLR